jgi:hypothetical protein
MTRPGFFLVLCLTAGVILGSFALAANPGGDGNPTIENALVVQQACVVARDHLLRGEPKKAVDLLEANLARINGDRKFLSLLRDAYRAYVKDLTLARQPVLLDVYKKRLQILDDIDSSAVASAPAPSAPAVPAPKVMAKADAKPVGPVVPPATKPITAMVVRGAAPDPFDSANELKPSVAAAPLNAAKSIIARADGEFDQKHYLAAKLLYEQAFQADATLASIDARQRWAYCQLSGIVDQVNSPAGAASDWAKIEADVHQAVEIAPHLAKTGDYLLAEIQKRRGGAALVMAASAPSVTVQHQQSPVNGWKIAETTYFRILHHQTPEIAEKVARIAEQTRWTMSRKWFGKDDIEWPSKCDIYLHASAAEYTQYTNLSATTSGHSRTDLDDRTGRVILRQIHLRCDNSFGLFDSVLPHEATHVVLAGQFGDFKHVPRWVDEGVAVLTEPAEKIGQHKKNLARSLNSLELIPLRQLVALDQYPTTNPQVSTFYAQSVALVDFLSKLKGPTVFTQFVRDSLQSGFEPALRQHYGYQSIADLQNRFTDQVRADVAAAGQSYAGK